MIRHRDWKRRIILRELHSLQISQQHCAKLFGVSRPVVSVMARSMGLKFSKAWMRKKRTDGVVADLRRVDEMAALYASGQTLAQIGLCYGVTRERVRQILSKHKGMDRTSGGQYAAADAARKDRLQAANDRYLVKYGCTFEQWREIRDMGRGGGYRGPLAAFRNQRNNAKNRGIGWELSFWQWWTIWQASGHWEQRGRGHGKFVMCRRGDAGPYAVGNVFISTLERNSSDAQARKRVDPNLPIGVSRTKSGRFKAHRGTEHLGTFDTPEQAHAAYLVGVRTKPKKAIGETKGYYAAYDGKYRAYLYVGKRYVHLGVFANADEARAAHLAAKARAA